MMKRSFLLFLIAFAPGALAFEGTRLQNEAEQCVNGMSGGDCLENTLDTVPKKVEANSEIDSEVEDDDEYDEDGDEEDDKEYDTSDIFIDVGVPQKFNPEEVDADDFLDIQIDAMRHLIAVAQNPDLAHILPECRNKHELCTQWALEGACDTEFSENRHYIDTHCCPACWASAQLDFLQRCPPPPGMPDALKPGDVTRLFTNVTTLEKYAKYEPKVHSRPFYLPGDTEQTAEYAKGPWIVTLENVLTDEEMDRLIHWGDELGWYLSLDGGEENEDGTSGPAVSEGRNSHENFCIDECYEDPLVKGILDQLSAITNIPEPYSDYLQLLRYEPGQFYEPHFDWHSYQAHSASGPRIITLLVYISDVEKGGQTNFPHLGVTVKPKKGRAVLWTNVLDENPDVGDELAMHQALPVVKGLKYAATAWFHMRDFKSADDNDCATNHVW